jgi:AcrR family transcriptional regulator
MAGRRQSSEVRQVELTDAALRIIATRGIAALTTRALADQVGLSTGAIFRHFVSLDALLEAVAARVEALLEETYPPPDLPPLERLERFVEARSAAVGGQAGVLRLMLSEQFLLALPEAASERLAACVDRTRAFLAACLREGQAAGQVRADVPAEALAPIVMGTVQMLALQRVNARREASDARGVRVGLVALLRPPVVAPAGRGKADP